MNEILIASKNPGKIREYRTLLEPLGFQIQSLLDYPDFPDISETGTTFSENALLKAVAVSGHFHIPCLADDSGLEVIALGGRPGVRSARFSTEGTDQKNNELLIRELSGITTRSARFVCVIAYYSSETGYRIFEGSIQGEIIDIPRGSDGFGYDPHFLVIEKGKTMAELPLSMKNEISHRGIALRRLVEWLAVVRQ